RDRARQQRGAARRPASADRGRAHAVLRRARQRARVDRRGADLGAGLRGERARHRAALPPRRGHRLRAHAGAGTAHQRAGERGAGALLLHPRQGADRSPDRTESLMARDLLDTAERMALLPTDVPRDAVIVTRNLHREYQMGGEVVHALAGVDITIRRNEFVAIMGPSGSGKSTLMNMIGCLDTPTSGEYWLNGHRVSELGDDALARIRNKEIGFVFQTFN